VALVYQNARYNAQDGIARAEDLLAGRLGPNQAPTNMFTETGIINYARPAEITAMVDKGHFIPDLRMPVIVPTASGAEDNFAFEILAFVELRAGIYRWGVNSDDGFRVSPAVSVTDPNNAITLGVFDGGRGAGDTVFDFAVAEDGLYPIRLVYEEGGGDANVEWWSIPDVSTDDPATATLAAINDPANATALKAFQPPSIPPAAQPQITSATLAAGRITIQWNNGGTLEYATSLNSPITWTPTGNSSGTFSEPAAGTKFYRVKR